MAAQYFIYGYVQIGHIIDVRGSVGFVRTKCEISKSLIVGIRCTYI